MDAMTVNLGPANVYCSFSAGRLVGSAQWLCNTSLKRKRRTAFSFASGLYYKAANAQGIRELSDGRAGQYLIWWKRKTVMSVPLRLLILDDQPASAAAWLDELREAG